MINQYYQLINLSDQYEMSVREDKWYSLIYYGIFAVVKKKQNGLIMAVYMLYL